MSFSGLIFYDTKVAIMNKVLNATVQRTIDHAAPEITLDPLEIVGGMKCIYFHTFIYFIWELSVLTWWLGLILTDFITQLSCFHFHKRFFFFTESMRSPQRPGVGLCVHLFIFSLWDSCSCEPDCIKVKARSNLSLIDS